MSYWIEALHVVCALDHVHGNRDHCSAERGGQRKSVSEQRTANVAQNCGVACEERT